MEIIKSFNIIFDKNNKIESVGDCNRYLPSIEDIKNISEWANAILKNQEIYNAHRIAFNSDIDEMFKKSYSTEYAIKKPKKLVKGGLYLIKDEVSDTLKIGFSTNIKSRLTQLQTATSHKLSLLYCIGNKTRKDEKLLHEEFKNLRLISEWFKNDESIIKYFKENGRGY